MTNMSPIRAAVPTNFIVDWGADKNAYAFFMYMFAECSLGISSSSYHFGPGDLLDFLSCTGQRAADAVAAPATVMKFAQRYGASPTDVDSLVAAMKKAKGQWTLFTLIAPTMQAGWGNVLDQTAKVLTKGSSDTFSVSLEALPAAPVAPATPTPSHTPQEQPAPAPVGNGVSCREFLLASDEDAQAMWSQAADAVNRPQVAAWGGRVNGISVCQDDPDRSLVSVAEVVSPY